MSRVALLVLCHHSPGLVAMLARRVSHPDTVTVVHVDKRAPVAAFAEAMAGMRQVSFVPEASRRAVHWAGFSMVEATFAAIRHALVVAPRTQRFVLLSGSDVPVYPIGTLLERLSGPDEWIRVDRELDPSGDGWFDSCASRVFLGDRSMLNPRSMSARAQDVVRRIEGRLERRTPYGHAIFYGPSWWSLTRPAIDHILQTYRTNPSVVDWFRWSRSPDEMVFQTLIKASPFAAHIRHDATRDHGDTGPANLAGVHYARFENGSASPETLVLDDLTDIRASGALFARKIDPNRSRSLLDALA